MNQSFNESFNELVNLFTKVENIRLKDCNSIKLSFLEEAGFEVVRIRELNLPPGRAQHLEKPTHFSTDLKHKSLGTGVVWLL